MIISKYLSLLALTLLALLAFHGSPVNACSCLPTHPQTYFCNADFVLAVRVLRQTPNPPMQTIFKLQVIRRYKPKTANETAIEPKKRQIIRLTTASNSAACGAILQTGKIYVIAGTGDSINSCGFIREYTSLSVVERRGLLGWYNCKCKVTPCWGDSCQSNRETATSCKWTPFAKCETSFSACLPTRFRTPEGIVTSCAWRKTRKYQQCMKNP